MLGAIGVQGFGINIKNTGHAATGAAFFQCWLMRGLWLGIILRRGQAGISGGIQHFSFFLQARLNHRKPIC